MHSYTRWHMNTRTIAHMVIHRVTILYVRLFTIVACWAFPGPGQIIFGRGKKAYNEVQYSAAPLLSDLLNKIANLIFLLKKFKYYISNV